MENKSARGLKIFAIVMMGFTAAMNVLGGSGTVCAAFLKKYYFAFKAIYDADLNWLYQTLMITTIIIGIAGIWSLIKLIKGNKKALTWALIVLVIGTILSATQYFTSLNVMGKAAPANVKFYINAATLILFLVIRFTSLKGKVDFEKSSSKTDNNMAGGLSAFIAGLAFLTVFIWAGPSHTYMGESWVELYTTPIIIAGVSFVTFGLISIIKSFFSMISEEAKVTSPKSS